MINVMGCCFCCCRSNGIKNIYSKYPEVGKHAHEFHALMFSEVEIGKLFVIFQHIDVDGSGSIETAEILAFLDMDVTPFTKRVFSIFDDDASGEIDFREFVLTLWNYCTQTHSTLTVFAFDMYDQDGSGLIDKTEIENMLTDVYGDKFKTNAFAKGIVYNIQQLEDDVTIDIFDQFCRDKPLLLFPVFEAQDRLCQRVLGDSFWKKNAEKRFTLCNGQMIPLKLYMEKFLVQEQQVNHEKRKQDKVDGVEPHHYFTNEEGQDDETLEGLSSGVANMMGLKVSAAANKPAVRPAKYTKGGKLGPKEEAVPVAAPVDTEKKKHKKSGTDDHHHHDDNGHHHHHHVGNAPQKLQYHDDDNKDASDPHHQHRKTIAEKHEKHAARRQSQVDAHNDQEHSHGGKKRKSSVVPKG